METGHFRAKYVTCQSEQSIRIKLDGPKDGRLKKRKLNGPSKMKLWYIRSFTLTLFGHSLFTNRTVHFKSNGRPFWQMTFVFIRSWQVRKSDLIKYRLFFNRPSTLSPMTAHYDEWPSTFAFDRLKAIYYLYCPWPITLMLLTVTQYRLLPNGPSTFASLFVHFRVRFNLIEFELGFFVQDLLIWSRTVSKWFCCNCIFSTLKIDV